MHTIAEEGVDVGALQDVRMTSAEMRTYERVAQVKGYCAYWNDRKGDDRRIRVSTIVKRTPRVHPISS